MAVYVFKLLVGYVPNGVDNAQGYRARMLRDLPYSVKHVFTEVPVRKYIGRYNKNGVSTDQMMSMHQYFTDNHSLELEEKVKNKLPELKKVLHYTEIERMKEEIRLRKDGSVIATILLDEHNNDYFYGIHYYNHGKLVRTEIYTKGISYVNYYITAYENDIPYAKLVRRTFYNRDGSVAFDQIFGEKEEWYVFPKGKVYTKVQLITEFIKRLNLSDSDTIVLDRPAIQELLQPLFQFGRDARLIVIIHSGHFFKNGEDPHSKYLNWEYYYCFKYSEMIDAMVVSTQEQKQELMEKLQEYQCNVPDIVVIPAGGLDVLQYPEEGRYPYSLISVSRLDKRKKIDWIIRAVIKAHGINPHIFIDIYGHDDGDKDNMKYLEDLVSLNNAQSYIRFMGQADVTEVYKNYEVYISASLWETFGLSLMEAVGSGTAMIGLDVKYGNHLFIQPEKNGYLVDFDLCYVEGNDDALIDRIADRIVEIFSDKEKLKEFQHGSYEIGKQFLSEVIEEKWKAFLFPDNSKCCSREHN